MDPIHFNNLVCGNKTKSCSNKNVNFNKRGAVANLYTEDRLKLSSKNTKSLNDTTNNHKRQVQEKEKFPNGYLEDWNSLNYQIKDISNPRQKLQSLSRQKNDSLSHQKNDSLSQQKSESLTHQYDHSKSRQKDISDSQQKDYSKSKEKDYSKSREKDISNSQQKDDSKSLISESQQKDDSNGNKGFREDINEFKPASIILLTNDNILLSKDNLYTIRFSTGMVEGNGLSINELGNKITFENEGSYRFEIHGEANPFSDVSMKLVFHSELFTDDIRLFSEMNIAKEENKFPIRALSTILPIQNGQNISIHLIPTPEESVVLMGNARLIIHRVA